MPKTQKIEIIPTKAIEIKPGHKYLLILPTAPEVNFQHLQPALEAFFGTAKVMAVVSDNIDKVKVAEYMED